MWRSKEVVLRLLLDKGVDATVAERNRWTPLHAALLNSHDVVVRLLLKQSAVVNSTETTGLTPLSHIAKNGHVDIAIALIALKPVSLNIGYYFGSSPLSVAS